MANLQDLTDQTYSDQIEKFEGIVLVDFWADWCTPCHMLAPTIEEIAEDYKDNSKVKVMKLDVDHNQNTAAKFGVMSIPTVIVFKNGNPVGQVVGVQPKENFVELIDRAGNN